MSDSDDTDILLLIPPDLFHVPLSDSEDHLDSCNRQPTKTGVVSELIDHMQTLESRISAIESRDSPNNSLDLSRRLSLESIMSCRQTIPRTKFSVSRQTSLQSTPTKASQCSPLPSTPNIHQKFNRTNDKQYHSNSNGTHQNTKRDPSLFKKHHQSKSLSEPFHSQRAIQFQSGLHAGLGSPGKESHSLLSPALNVSENNTSSRINKSLSTGLCSSDSKSIKDMNFPEVSQLLKEIQSNDTNKISKYCNSNGFSMQGDTGVSDKNNIICEMNAWTNNRMEQERKLTPNNHLHESMHLLNSGNQRDHLDRSLPESSFSSFNTDRFMTEFRTWNPSFSQEFDSSSKITKIDLKNLENHDNISINNQKETSKEILGNIENNAFPSTVNMHHEESKKENIDTNIHETPISSNSQMPSLSGSKSSPSIFKTPKNYTSAEALIATAELGCSTIGQTNRLQTNPISDLNEHQSSNETYQHLLTLSDIWNQDTCKPEVERLRLKLEEEKFRREHCEQMIQELQKKLLEQQEKIAVAIRVDNEKNSFISQFQVSWKRMQQKLYELETERENLQKVLKTISDKHQLEVLEYEKQTLKYKEELSKAINLATGYKDKSDTLVQEKVELLKNHADELQNYQTLLQQSEGRYEETKAECQKLLEKNKNVDDTLSSVQQDFNAELMKSSQVRDELSVIHRALDACEAELVILRQEKENLQLMIKDENSRNSILEKANNSLVAAVEEAQKAEKSAKNEAKALSEQQEKLRAELRDVYQKQVDEVVKTKLFEFQTQLDSAEAVFQNEVETKQRAIAECAARKIKSVMDKHQLEVHLMEEKHKEEKKLFEIKLAQAVQKSSILEAQLNSYRKSKSQLVEQLHSMLQKQWQQALLIISGSNGESMKSFQKFNVEKLFDFQNMENLELIPEHCSTLRTEPVKSDEQKNLNVKSSLAQEAQNESLITLTSNDESPLTARKESKNDLKKYIKMILDIQQKDDYQKANFVEENPALCQQQVSCKQSSLGQSRAMTNEGSSKWEAISELSIHDTSEYLSPPQKFTFKGEQTREKPPPWK